MEREAEEENDEKDVEEEGGTGGGEKEGIGEEEDEESSKLTIAKKGVTIDGDNIVNGDITANNLSVGKTFKVGKLDVGITIERLEKENQTLTQQNKQMQEDIEKLKSQIKPLVGE